MSRTKEEYFILRLPERHADRVNSAIRQRNLGGSLEIEMGAHPKGKCAVYVEGERLTGKLVSLPTITETLKTYDKKHFYKLGDVSQMLVCTEGVGSDDSDDASAEDVDEPEQLDKWPHGLSRPLKNVRRKRFRKTAPKRADDAHDPQSAVEQLLMHDREAEEVTFYLIEDDMGDVEENTNTVTDMEPDVANLRDLEDFAPVVAGDAATVESGSSSNLKVVHEVSAPKPASVASIRKVASMPDSNISAAKTPAVVAKAPAAISAKSLISTAPAVAKTQVTSVKTIRDGPPAMPARAVPPQGSATMSVKPPGSLARPTTTTTTETKPQRAPQSATTKPSQVELRSIPQPLTETKPTVNTELQTKLPTQSTTAKESTISVPTVTPKPSQTQPIAATDSTKTVLPPVPVDTQAAPMADVTGTASKPAQSDGASDLSNQQQQLAKEIAELEKQVAGANNPIIKKRFQAKLDAKRSEAASL